MAGLADVQAVKKDPEWMKKKPKPKKEESRRDEEDDESEPEMD